MLRLRGTSVVAAAMAMGCSPILGLSGEYTTATDAGGDGPVKVPPEDVGPGGSDAPSPGTLPFQPSNIGADAVAALAAMAQAEDVESADCQIQTIAKNLGAGCLMSPITTTTEPSGAGQTQTVALIVVQSLKIGPNGTIMVEGDLPLVIVSLGDVTLDSNAAILANSSSSLDYLGPGAAAAQGDSSSKGLGPGGGPAGSLTTYIGAGGGSFCGLGGAGGGTTAESPAYGSADVRPLQGGSSGGSGTGAPGGSGAGGGAIQIVAAGTITVNTHAYITVGGQGAQSCIESACSAGGSGGAILLEAPTVTVAGILAANGGGGGSGQTAGSDGLPLSGGTPPTAASGGAAAAGSAAAGGNGSAGTMIAGGAGQPGSSNVIPGAAEAARAGSGSTRGRAWRPSQVGRCRRTRRRSASHREACGRQA
jgi:hypothetical protein